MGIDMGIDKRCKKKLESIKAISLKLVCAGVILRHMTGKVQTGDGNHPADVYK